MKALLFVLIALSSVSSFAAGYGAAGCGLGSIVIGDKPGFSQIFAATTNGTSGSQTFGITSGTSNCGSAGKSAIMFIEANKAALATDISRGQGETLSSLAAIYGIKDTKAMGSLLQKDQASIFATQDAKTISAKIESLLKSNKTL